MQPPLGEAGADLAPRERRVQRPWLWDLGRSTPRLGLGTASGEGVMTPGMESALHRDRPVRVSPRIRVAITTVVIA